MSECRNPSSTSMSLRTSVTSQEQVTTMSEAKDARSVTPVPGSTANTNGDENLSDYLFDAEAPDASRRFSARAQVGKQNGPHAEIARRILNRLSINDDPDVNHQVGT